MSFSYSPTLATEKDWVRFMTGDRVNSDPQLQDQEIEALLREEPNKYLAAARAGDMIIANDATDIVSKSVGDLSISYGTGSSEEAYKRHVDKLRERGNQLLLGSDGGGSVFRML